MRADVATADVLDIFSALRVGALHGALYRDHGDLATRRGQVLRRLSV